MLDMSGPTQAFLAAKQLGADYELSYCSLREEIGDSAGLHIGRLQHYEDVTLGSGDYLFLPGFRSRILQQQQADKEWDGVYEWIRNQHARGATICSVCIGAFLVAKAGLLDGRKCTTHWSVVPLLKKGFPKATVVDDVLFTGDPESAIYTSAGISSGIDLALHLLEEAHGPLFVHKVARDLVVYLRRGHDHPQDSVYLNYRNHLHRGIHQLQDWLIGHLDRKMTIDEMAEMVNMSPRNLTRTFKVQTGISVHQYLTLLRLEQAKNLRYTPGITMRDIAQQCGFANERQLQRILKEN